MIGVPFSLEKFIELAQAFAGETGVDEMLALARRAPAGTVLGLVEGERVSDLISTVELRAERLSTHGKVVPDFDGYAGNLRRLSGDTGLRSYYLQTPDASYRLTLTTDSRYVGCLGFTRVSSG